jgi:uncharacterized cupin superfamily protein
MAKKIDIAKAESRTGSGYPAPFRAPCATRVRRTLGDAAGLTQFGVNLLTLPAGAWSSQRHWHSREDEFVYVLEGEVVLVTTCRIARSTPRSCSRSGRATRATT